MSRTVHDTGIGIPEDRIHSIFAAFTQVDDSSTRAHDGTGLGLAITHHFCKLMGGRIDVKSILGKGSTFIIHAPFDRPEDPLTLKEKMTLRSATETGRVLVIDDDPDIHQLIGGFLGDLGIDSHSAFSGEKGLQLANSIKPQLITLDIMMSGISGWDVLEALKKDPETSTIPVAIISFVNEPDRATAQGACCHMLKPVQRRNLAQLIHEHVV